MIKLIYKEKGISSFQKIRQFAKENNIKKIGHSGTLDPLATGLLLVATDDDTKLLDYIDKNTKAYIATMQFGYNSNTLDCCGDIEKSSKYRKITEKEVHKAFEHFCGKYKQLPPQFSAKKVNGVRSYELARKDIAVELEPVEVEIKDIKLLEFDENMNTVKFEVEVSRGTYIRSLIKDIAAFLKTDAIMIALERHKINNLGLEDLKREKISPLELINANKIEITEAELKTLLKGLSFIKEYSDTDEIMLIYNKNIVGFATIKDKKVKTKKLFGNKINKILGD
ncbi:tRNA pseudouridine(55) synthase TruB [Mycoplasma procyoni]|uniref:tRNA pseudouridine(55) synthase TruB n=1 Tax=Mycoplasma procyoni TaxID=568784 RepID=UPI00197C1C5F|nr:tRNA pseudouridine(55) synthase TruB [Mycoplasma procyoni]MBN3535131.1 tRNA pseudouridine(55) synthase TruB [Mycoplasma procyoni]